MVIFRSRSIGALAISICALLLVTRDSHASERHTNDQPAASEAVRIWSDSSGRYQIEGSFLGYGDGRVSLLKTDGSEISVPLDRLSEPDGNYVRSKLRSSMPTERLPDEATAVKEEDTRRREAAEELLRKAIIADLDGDSIYRNEMLAKAVDTDPDFAPARWLSGLVRGSKNSPAETWLSVERAEQLAANDPVLAQYARRRGEMEDNAKSQEALALWCRKQGLDEQEKIHWRRVLTHDPKHRAAQRCLQLQEHNGRLLTRGQIAAAKQQAVVLEQKRKEWMPKLNDWRKAIQSHDEAAADEARREMEELRDPDLVGLLESYLAPRSERLSNAVVEALGNIPAQTATDSLVRHAVKSQWSGVRRAAAERLKDRPKYSYVPLLIDAMTAPLKLSSWVNGLDVGYLVLQEGKNIDYMLEGAVEVRAIATSYDDNRETDQARSIDAAENAKRSRAKEVVRDLENYIDRKNQAAAQVNEPIRRALVVTTGEDFGLDPVEWNDWWNELNENEVPARKPVLTSHKCDRTYAQYVPVQGAIRKSESNVRTPDFAGGWSRFMESQTTRLFNQPDDPSTVQDFQNDFLLETTRQSAEAKRYQDELRSERQRRQAEEALERERRRKEWESKNPEEAARQKRLREQRLAERAANPCECFPAGTPVRTQCGQRPIEEIRIGDLVLTQNPDSGELAYKPVVRTTVRPADKLLEISLGGEILRTTKGHPMWVGGQGWRIAKYIQPGDRFHRYFGSIKVEAVREVPVNENVYNLVVGDFHSYFVGENSVLVHDNSVITPPGVTFLGQELVAE